MDSISNEENETRNEGEKSKRQSSIRRRNRTRKNGDIALKKCRIGVMRPSRDIKYRSEVVKVSGWKGQGEEKRGPVGEERKRGYRNLLVANNWRGADRSALLRRHRIALVLLLRLQQERPDQLLRYLCHRHENKNERVSGIEEGRYDSSNSLSLL